MTSVTPPDVTLGELYRCVQRVEAKLDTHFVSKEEHGSLKDRVKFLERIVFGFCGLIILTVLGAIVTGVIK